MFHRLRQKLAPPIFEGDEERTRIAGLLNSTLLATLIVGTIFVPIGALTKGCNPKVILIMGVLIGLTPFMWMLLQRGYVFSTSLFFVSMFFLAAIYCVSVVGSISAPITSTFILCIVAAGLYFGHWGTFAATVLSILAVSGLWMAEISGRFPEYRAAGADPLVTYVSLLISCAILLFVFTGSLRNSQVRARRGEETLAERNLQLEFEIEERRQAEKALGESERRLRQALESAHAGIWEWNIQTNQIIWSLENYKLYGVNPADPPPSCDTWLAFIHPDDRQNTRIALDDAIELRTPEYKSEFRINHPKLGLRWVLGIGQVDSPARGFPLRLLGMNIDITDRKLMEEELRISRSELEVRVQQRTAQLQTANEELQKANEEMRQTPIRLITAQEEERKRLAFELHDSIGQALAALKFRAEQMISSFEEGESQEAFRMAEQLVPAFQRSIEEIRAICMGLRPKVLEDFGVIAALQWYREELVKLHPEIHIDLEISIMENDIPPELVVPIFRIAQEALNNVSKHSRAEWVDFSLSKKDCIELTVSDDGRGMDLELILHSSTARSLGLMSMKERAELTGGNFSIESTPGEGTTVRVRWPADGLEKAE